MMPSFSYVRPSRLDEALRLLAAGDARIYGGGTDLLGCLREHILTPATVVSVSRIDELRGIHRTEDGGLRLGALATITEVAEHPEVRERFTALADAAGQVASPQLRHQGTIAGNLCQKPRCWYYRSDLRCLRKGGETCFAYGGENQYHCIFGGDRCYYVHPSDPAPALAALGASARISGSSSSRVVRVDELHVPPSVDPHRETVLEPDELITEVVLPAPPAGLRSTYRKVRARAAWDFALVGAALALVMEGAVVRQARIFLSGVAPVPWRSAAAERVLTGRRLDGNALDRAAAAATDGAEPLANNGYKVALLQGLVRERLEVLAKA